MNRSLLFGLIGFVFVVIGLVFIVDKLSYKSVFIDFKQHNVSIRIYKDKSENNSEELFELSNDTDIKLKNGSYYYLTKGDKFGEQKVSFEVIENSTVEISPPYSLDYLAKKLDVEKEIIHSLLKSTYSDKLSDYIIADEQLYNHGEWYSAKLIQRVSGGAQPDVYRLILKKDNNWVISVSPRLIITLADFNEVPEYIINSVNKPLSTAAYDLLYL